MDALRKKLINTADALGICKQGHSEIERAADRAALVDYYVANPDWCMERDFPTLEELRAGWADCEEYGVYVDKEFHGELLNERQAYIFHHCKGEIKVGLNVDKAIIPMLYFANDCQITIIGDGARAMVPVYCFGENLVASEGNGKTVFKFYNERVKK